MKCIIYPPLVIRLASVTRLLEKLEKGIIRLPASEYSEISKRPGEDIVFTVDITKTTLFETGFNSSVTGVIGEFGIGEKQFCLKSLSRLRLSLTTK